MVCPLAVVIKTSYYNIESDTGMFLFCTLVLRNLYGQSRKIDFDREMEPHIFPSGLEDVYVLFIQLYGTDLHGN